MEGKKFETPINNASESTEDEDKRFAEMLAAENEGIVPGEFGANMEDAEIEEGDIFEGAVNGILSRAKEMVMDELDDFLTADEKLMAEQIIRKKIAIKRASSYELWANQMNSIIQEDGGDVSEFKERAANNLYREIKDAILEKLEKSEQAN